jgi:hypothetical protein
MEDVLYYRETSRFPIQDIRDYRFVCILSTQRPSIVFDAQNVRPVRQCTLSITVMEHSREIKAIEANKRLYLPHFEGAKCVYHLLYDLYDRLEHNADRFRFLVSGDFASRQTHPNFAERCEEIPEPIDMDLIFKAVEMLPFDFETAEIWVLTVSFSPLAKLASYFGPRYLGRSKRQGWYMRSVCTSPSFIVAFEEKTQSIFLTIRIATWHCYKYQLCSVVFESFDIACVSEKPVFLAKVEHWDWQDNMS